MMLDEMRNGEEGGMNGNEDTDNGYDTDYLAGRLVD